MFRYTSIEYTTKLTIYVYVGNKTFHMNNNFLSSAHSSDYFIFVSCRNTITESYLMKSRRRWGPFQMNLCPTLPPASLFFSSTHIWPCVSVLWSDLSCLTTTLLNCSHTTQMHIVQHRLRPHSIPVHQCPQACHLPVRYQQSYLSSPQRCTHRQAQCRPHCAHRRLELHSAT